MPSAQPLSRNHCGQSDRPRKLGKKCSNNAREAQRRSITGRASFFLSWTESGENDASKFSDLGDCTKIRMFALGVDNEVQFDVKDIFQ